MPSHDNPIVHIVLNGKGGIGKSTLATMLAQWKVELAPGCVTCIDTDPINATFAAYTSECPTPQQRFKKSPEQRSLIHALSVITTRRWSRAHKQRVDRLGLTVERGAQALE